MGVVDRRGQLKTTRVLSPLSKGDYPAGAGESFPGGYYTHGMGTVDDVRRQFVTRQVSARLGKRLRDALLLLGGLWCTLAVAPDLTLMARASAAEAVDVGIAFATDRAPTGSTDPRDFYGSDRAAELTFGRATVTFPADPESSDLFNRDSTLRAILPQQGTAADTLDGFAWERTDRTVLVYVAGFMKSFADATEDLAHIVRGADYPGVPVLFSWPAGNSPFGYGTDRENLRGSAPMLKALLGQLAGLETIERIHLVAHSMGNQALLPILLEALQDGLLAEAQVGELILYAPDVDRTEFLAETLPALRAHNIRTTLYVARFDVPLLTSRVVNRGARLGDADAGIPVSPGMETIETTAVADFYDRHNHHLDPPIQTDVGLLLNEGLGAAQRSTLVAVDSDEGRYWQILRD